MRKTIIVGLILSLAIILSACSGSPDIAVEPSAYDFGEIPAAEPVTTRIQVRNNGRRTLHITGVRTSCGCTTAKVENDTLGPGETTDLAVTFDPLAHDGLYGPLLRIVYVQSDDPDVPELEIPINVTVLAPEEAKQ
jgi:hypothetical protein